MDVKQEGIHKLRERRIWSEMIGEGKKIRERGNQKPVETHGRLLHNSPENIKEKQSENQLDYVV